MLALAHRRGLIADLEACLRGLRQQGFWLSDDVVAAVLQRGRAEE